MIKIGVFRHTYSVLSIIIFVCETEPAPGHQQHCVGNAAVARNNPRLRRLFTLEEEEEEEEDSFEDYYIMATQRNV